MNHRARMMLLLVLVTSSATAKPPDAPSYTPTEDPDVLRDLDATTPETAKALEDTLWIADWTFDAAGGGCEATGWIKYDARIFNDGTNYWQVTTDYDGAGGGRITGPAAALRKHDLCWPIPDGYGNNWDYSIILKYAGPNATLSFEYIIHSEPDFDFVTVEADSLGLSEARVNYAVRPRGDYPWEFREVLLTDDGNNSTGVTVDALPLPDYGPGTHEVYIRFAPDGAVSPEDGEYATSIGAGLVVDNLLVSGEITYSEDFSGVLDPNVTLANTALATPFGEWARLYKHITDNDNCTDNSTCAWLWTDPAVPAYFPEMAFGPGGAVIRKWLDNIIVSPWASLEGTPAASRSVLSFRRFPGNRFTQGPIVQGWRVRGKTRIENTDTSTLGDSIDCISPWGHTSMFNSLTLFSWVTALFDATPFFDPASREVQVSFRVVDWLLLTGPPPATINPGPGPYLDRVRIGRKILAGPILDIGTDTRFQAQDRFPSTVNPSMPGEHHSPTTERFGTCDFSIGQHHPAGSNIITGDSITTNVLDARSAGGITGVRCYGAIVQGPHAGKAPAPYVVAPNGFFEVPADSARNSTGAAVANRWFVDLDDSYLRGGDVLLYFWYATDAGGGSSSAPAGLSSLPTSVAMAEVATGGLFEVTALPKIDWSPAYLARITSDPHGDLEPTPEEIAASSQHNCILYYQHTTSNRRSSPTNRTSFMRTLDVLGYGGNYDVYDLQGSGGTYNPLAARGTTAQCTGYQLIVEDDGRSNLTPNIPHSAIWDVDQATFYQNWLDAGATSEAGRATLWILGEGTASEYPTSSLFTTHCGMSSVVQNQGVSLNPDVVGQAAFTFAPSTCTTSFTGDRFSLQGGCQPYRNFDGFTPAAGAVATHVYQDGSTVGPAAILMNARPATSANTILMGFAWFDVRDPSCTPPNCPSPIVPPAMLLMSKILSCVRTSSCLQAFDPTDAPREDGLDAPLISALHPNVPNPFNPTTVISFDLSRSGHVRLEVLSVSGRHVRTLVNGDLSAGRNHRIVWDGLDDAGARVASGVYFNRLAAPDRTVTRKLVVLE